MCFAEHCRFRQRRQLGVQQQRQRETAQRQLPCVRISGALCPRIYSLRGECSGEKSSCRPLAFAPRVRLAAAPASGLRRADTNGGVPAGELDEVGIWGFSWSASPNAAGSGNASNLQFNSNGNVNPLNNNYRGHGFPVRCARAFTLLEKKIF